MADKGKGKADARYKPWQRRRHGAAGTETEAVDDTAGTSSRTSGRTETAGGGGTQQELPPGVSYQFSGAPGGGGGTGLSQSQLRIPTTTTTVQQPLSNQGAFSPLPRKWQNSFSLLVPRGSAPFGGQNQIANPQFAGGGGGGGSGAGYGGFSQFAGGE
ncbi:keratin, type I cytoskeletal 10-like [Triticum aestivum]|uniref:keratin, type I cytoskeletal 10-like n=1 Tax=Triticum aestivum TaxID=4565 RepID=UPI001D004708|nr:keratin, type I cytoskeletal 10-like [Triticum aestivum]